MTTAQAPWGVAPSQEEFPSQVGEHWAGAEGRAYVRVSPGCQLWPGHPLNKRRWGNQGEPKNTFGSLVPPRIAPPPQHTTTPPHTYARTGGAAKRRKEPRLHTLPVGRYPNLWRHFSCKGCVHRTDRHTPVYRTAPPPLSSSPPLLSSIVLTLG